MACAFCGKNCSYYDLCKECNELKENGDIEQCEECGEWHYFDELCECEEENICEICGEPSGEYPLCKKCYKERLCDVCKKPSGEHPLCKDCFNLKLENKLKTCENCNKWFLIEKGCECGTKNKQKNENVKISDKAEKLKLIYNKTNNNDNQVCGDYYIGDRVEHNSFGLGIIKRITNDDRVIVKFDKHGEKDYARVSLFNMENITAKEKEIDKRVEEKIKEKYKTELPHKVIIEKDIVNHKIKDNSIIQNIDEEIEKMIKFRKNNPPKIVCEDGHKVRSRAEKIIDDFLNFRDIKHNYELKINLPDGEKLYYDFLLPKDNIYIEFWGVHNKEEYDMNKERKQYLYKKYNLKLIELEDKHIDILVDCLPDMIRDKKAN